MLFELPSCLVNVFLEVSTTLGRGKLSKRSGGRVDLEGFLLDGLGVPIFYFSQELKGINSIYEVGIKHRVRGVTCSKRGKKNPPLRGKYFKKGITQIIGSNF